MNDPETPRPPKFVLPPEAKAMQDRLEDTCDRIAEKVREMLAEDGWTDAKFGKMTAVLIFAVPFPQSTVGLMSSTHNTENVIAQRLSLAFAEQMTERSN